MTKVINFSQKFPDYHSRAGSPTFFVEKFLTYKVGHTWHKPWYLEKLMALPENEGKQHLIPDFVKNLSYITDIDPIKKHTVRGDYRWLPGSKFSPRVWSDVPYRSKTIAFWEDTTVEKVLEFVWYLDDTYPIVNGKTLDIYSLEALAKNDGLQMDDFKEWFRSDPDFQKRGKFTGIINCWDPNIFY